MPALTRPVPTDPDNPASPDPGSALTVRGLSAGYGKSLVVRDVDLDVGRGEIVALLGRNGVGKTTTLLAIAGYLSRMTGSVTMLGKPLQGSVFRRTAAGLGVVLEGRSVFPSLTVGRNLTVARAPVEEVMEMFPELAGRLDTPAGMLSGGEQQMLALGRAMARHPHLLLIDEVSFGLSPIMCGRLFAGMRESVAENGTGILLVEQHLHYAASVCDRAVVMNDGELRLELPGSELMVREAEVERLYLADVTASASDRATS